MHSDSKRCIQTAKQVFPSLWRKGMSHFKIITSLPYTPSWRAEGQLQVIFAHFKCWRFKYQAGLCRSPLSAKKITFRKRKIGKTSYVLGCGTVLAAFRCWRLYTKIPFPPRCSFLARYSTSCQVSEACGGRNINEYVVIYLPFRQHPRLFRGARFRMWGHAKSEKTSQDEISLAVGNLDSRLWRHPT